MDTTAPYTLTTKRIGRARCSQANTPRHEHIATLRGRYGSAVLDATGPTAADARALLLQLAADCLDDVGRITTAFCANGTVLTLFRGIYGWEYTISDTSRAYASGVLSRETDRKAAEARMLDHGASAYGGIVKVLR